MKTSKQAVSRYEQPVSVYVWLEPSLFLVLCTMIVCHLTLNGSVEGKPSLHATGRFVENRMILQDRAILHVNLMNSIGICRDPRPQVVYPATTLHKFYYPRGTLVHRCNDQVGCCPNLGEVCRPKAVDRIERVFFVHHYASFVGGQRTRTLKRPPKNFTTTTETVTFTNHTACKCIKLASDAIEHDEMQSVISRPLVKPITSLPSNTTVYHMIGAFASIAFFIILIFAYKSMSRNILLEAI